jgi:hypothetical protein
MTKQASEARVTNITPITGISVTTGTRTWIEAMYEAGAVAISADGGVALNPEVRELVKALHAVLAGGDVQIQIRSTGGETFRKLEGQFDLAMDEASAANRDADNDNGEIDPYVP